MNKRKYRFLTNSFLIGSIKSQINSVYRDREEKPEKVVEFHRALRNRDCIIDFKNITKHQLGKIIELGFFNKSLKSL